MSTLEAALDRCGSDSSLKRLKLAKAQTFAARGPTLDSPSILDQVGSPDSFIWIQLKIGDPNLRIHREALEAVVRFDKCDVDPCWQNHHNRIHDFDDWTIAQLIINKPLAHISLWLVDDAVLAQFSGPSRAPHVHAILENDEEPSQFDEAVT